MLVVVHYAGKTILWREKHIFSAFMCFLHALLMLALADRPLVDRKSHSTRNQI